MYVVFIYLFFFMVYNALEMINENLSIGRKIIRNVTELVPYFCFYIGLIKR